MTADQISNMFGWHINRRFKGKLHTEFERPDHSHHTFRAYFKNSFVKQYEKYRTFLRMEVCCNHLPDLRIKKSLEHLDTVRRVSKEILDRFSQIRSSALNAHVDFPLLQRLTLPITLRNTRIAGIKIQDTRMIRLMETIMHAGTCPNGWSSAYIHKAVVETFKLSEYTITQLRYDLQEMKAHGLVERNGRQYSFVFTERGMKVETMFTLFHKRLFGPLANSLFHHRPSKMIIANSKLEKAYHQADDNIEEITELLGT